MEVRWKDVLWKAAEEVMKQGGRVEFVVYKRDNKRIPLVRSFPDNEIRCNEEVFVD